MAEPSVPNDCATLATKRKAKTQGAKPRKFPAVDAVCHDVQTRKYGWLAFLSHSVVLERYRYMSPTIRALLLLSP